MSHSRVVTTRCSLIDSSGHCNITQGVPVVLDLSKESVDKTSTAQVNGNRDTGGKEHSSTHACLSNILATQDLKIRPQTNKGARVHMGTRKGAGLYGPLKNGKQALTTVLHR